LLSQVTLEGQRQTPHFRPLLQTENLYRSARLFIGACLTRDATSHRLSRSFIAAPNAVMNQAHIADIASVANPFATFMDPTVCMQAHERLAGLPQKLHRPLDKPIIPKGTELLADSTEDDEDGDTEMADLDDLVGAADISDISSISEIDLLHC